MNHPSSVAHRALACSAILGVGLILALSGCGSGHGAGDAAKGVGMAAKGAGGAGASGAGASGEGGYRGTTISVMSQLAPEGPLMVVSDTSGTVSPVTQSKVAAKIAGTVAKVLHLAGDWVKAGETVIQLDDTQLKLSVETAQSALDNAKIVLSTNEDTTSQASPRLALQVQSAEAALALAQKNFDSTQALFKVGGATSSQVDGAQSPAAIGRGQPGLRQDGPRPEPEGGHAEPRDAEDRGRSGRQPAQAGRGESGKCLREGALRGTDIGDQRQPRRVSRHELDRLRPRQRGQGSGLQRSALRRHASRDRLQAEFRLRGKGISDLGTAAALGAGRAVWCP